MSDDVSCTLTNTTTGEAVSFEHNLTCNGVSISSLIQKEVCDVSFTMPAHPVTVTCEFTFEAQGM